MRSNRLWQVLAALAVVGLLIWGLGTAEAPLQTTEDADLPGVSRGLIGQEDLAVGAEGQSPHLPSSDAYQESDQSHPVTVIGVVVSDEGKPCPGATLLVDQQEVVRRIDVADPDGFFEVSVEPGTRLLRLQAVGDEGLSKVLSVAPSRYDGGRVRLVIHTGARLTVIVEDSNGAPISGASVRGFPFLESGSSVTDGLGTITGRVPLGETHLSVVHGGMVGRATVQPDAGSHHEVTIRLTERAASLSIQLEGEAPKGSRVRVFPMLDEASKPVSAGELLQFEVSREVATDGCAIVVEVPGVGATAEHFSASDVSDAMAVNRPLVVRIGPRASVALRVLDGGGTPIPLTRVALVPLQGPRSRFRATTDERGDAALGLIPEGRYALFADSLGTNDESIAEIEVQGGVDRYVVRVLGLKAVVGRYVGPRYVLNVPVRIEAELSADPVPLDSEDAVLEMLQRQAARHHVKLCADGEFVVAVDSDIDWETRLALAARVAGRTLASKASPVADSASLSSELEVVDLEIRITRSGHALVDGTVIVSATIPEVGTLTHGMYVDRQSGTAKFRGTPLGKHQVWFRRKKGEERISLGEIEVTRGRRLIELELPQ